MPEEKEAFGQRRIYYNNFAAHLLNAYNPNVLYPGFPYGWPDADWFRVIDMVAGFGYTAFEFWLVPRLFCRAGIESDYGKVFVRQMNAVIDHAHSRGLQVELLCGLATVGSEWHTLCPHVADEWQEIQHLWDAWTRLLPGIDIVGLFPGDPGACSRNGCTAETYIDRCCDIAHRVRQNLPAAEMELHTWGPPIFGWGNLRGPAGWGGEFVQAWQHTAWDFSRTRAERAMAHLVKRLPDYPDPTSVAINLGFNSDGNPEGDEDARPWIREIAKTHPVQSWDFSLTEGENNVIPHYRLERLFAQRRRERKGAPYRGGICYTMTPLLNQLSLYAAARSFQEPDADCHAVAGDFYAALFGEAGRELVSYLPLFEVIKDWGNYVDIDLPREMYHSRMAELAERLQDLAGQERDTLILAPSAPAHREELLWFATLFRDLSAPNPDYEKLQQRYWQRVYAIYDSLPEHVDPRPRQATGRLCAFFAESMQNQAGPVAGKWS